MTLFFLLHLHIIDYSIVHVNINDSDQSLFFAIPTLYTLPIYLTKENTTVAKICLFQIKSGSDSEKSFPTERIKTRYFENNTKIGSDSASSSPTEKTQTCYLENITHTTTHLLGAKKNCKFHEH